MQALTPEESRALSKLYADIANALADYRLDHLAELSDSERAALESHEMKLRTTSSAIATKTIVIVLDGTGPALSGITRATKQLTTAARRAASAKRALALATSAVALGGAIVGGNPLAMAEAVKEALDVAEG